MKTINILFLSSLLFFSSIAVAQDSSTKTKRTAPIPVEVFFGNNRVVTQFSMNKKFSYSSRFGITANSYYAGSYDNVLKNNESMNFLFLTYEIYKGLGLASGAALNSQWGFRPFAGARHAYASKSISTMISSGFYLTQSQNFETKVVLQYRPHLKGNWSLYSRIEGLINQDMNTKKHDRSSIYGRLGVSFKSLGFGLATNYDWYGPVKFARENSGVFVSYAFR